MMAFVVSIIASNWQWVAAFAGAIAAVAGAWLKGHASGVAKAEARQARAREAAIGQSLKARASVDAMTDAGVKAELDKWARR
jgi:hypothetical protein